MTASSPGRRLLSVHPDGAVRVILFLSSPDQQHFARSGLKVW